MNRDLEHTQSQELEDGIASASDLRQQEPNNLPNNNADSVWQKFNILSLDGGGIRGYWSLLALEKLMEFVAEAEERSNRRMYHSFFPEPWPDHVSQIPLTQKQQQRASEANGEESKARVLPQARRFLPCHYFDNICGSSTGALIAIMLGRLRMTVPDCIHEYRRLGQLVFGNPRFFTSINFGVGDSYKYEATRLEKVFKDVTKRRNEMPTGDYFRPITFPSRSGLCTTFVTTEKSTQSDSMTSTPYLIRSYHHENKRRPHPPTAPTPGTNTGSSQANTSRSANPSVEVSEEEETGYATKNYERAHEFEIWQVARAATAAPFYFKPLKIEMARTSGSIDFTDGGFSYTNNPSEKGKTEIEDLHGHDKIGILVSVGTARKQKEEKKSFFNKLGREGRNMAYKATNPETIHEQIGKDQKREGFAYYRLNDLEGLDIEFDRWEPKQHWFNEDAGSHTIETIENIFHQWAVRVDTLRLLEKCAKMLVDCRMSRMSTDRWERYATGAQYRCCYQNCGREDIFNRYEFEAHLKQYHQIREDALQEDIVRCKFQWRYQDNSDTHTH